MSSVEDRRGNPGQCKDTGGHMAHQGNCKGFHMAEAQSCKRRKWAQEEGRGWIMKGLVYYHTKASEI